MTHAAKAPTPLRHDWTQLEVEALFDLPLMDLLHQAQSVHRAHHDPNRIQVSTLLSIKTGGCSEDCKYCAQSAKNSAGLDYESLMPLDEVVRRAGEAKAGGAGRFCMGAAWRSPKDRDMERIVAMVKAVKQLGMEACMTLGFLSESQARQLALAGLDYYNHNIDTSEEHYGKIVGTHSFEDRLATLRLARAAGLKLCTGGILGLGETRADRAAMLMTLANLPEHPESVPVNKLVPIPGTPLEGETPVDGLEVVRAIAVARILMPASQVRLSAGREAMSDELQALCFLAGANSVFGGAKLLTTPNAGEARDSSLFARLGLQAT
jgi:biotin synthase